MWTFWTTVVAFAIALGQFFFKGPSWDRYAIGVLILAGMGLGEGEEASRQRITRAQKRLGEMRAGHSWCKTFP